YLTNGQPERIVTLGKDAKYLNVARMETVRINVAGKSVTWNFDTLGTPTFLLSDIIPEAKGIRVYVSENPMYLGG
ncbi:CzcE family metal-binding protein, partial [Salmonella enterica subsp. enterica serovar Typhimurium]